MNFLAHVYLSGEQPDVRVGGFIADSIKGRDYNDYPAGIKKGILLHRSIDHFTDQHAVVHSCKLLLRKGYKKYSGIIIDIFFDHFLAANWSNFSNVPLHSFAQKNYRLLQENQAILPEEVQNFLPFLIQNDWFSMYASVDGIEKILQRMPTRTTLPAQASFGVKILTENYNLLRNYFFLFMGDAIQYVEENHKISIKKPRPVLIS